METKNNWFEKQCREHNLKLTPQRACIYKILSEAKDHPSTDTVFRRVKEHFPNVSLDTVNRTLLTFNEIGLAFLVEGSGDVRRYDAGMEDHQHFKCIKCKRIIDFHYEPFDNIDIPEVIEGKFEILRKSVYFEGLCDKCRTNE
ncbi:MAG: Fur family transcriptional regulator [Sedimentisphaeraceae bacterium JB056]